MDLTKSADLANGIAHCTAHSVQANALHVQVDTSWYQKDPVRSHALLATFQTTKVGSAVSVLTLAGSALLKTIALSA